MKKWHWVLIALALWSFIMFMAGRLTVPKMTTPVVIQPIDTIIVEKWRERTHYDTIYAKETLYIDSTTPIGSIPIRTQEFDGYLPVVINNKYRYNLHYEGSFDYRGIAYGYTLHSIPEPYIILLEQKQSFSISPFIALSCAYVFPHNSELHNFCAEARLGLKAWDLKAYISAGYYKEIMPMAGVCYEKAW